MGFIQSALPTSLTITQMCVYYSLHHSVLRATCHLKIITYSWVKWWVWWAASKMVSSDLYLLVFIPLCDLLPSSLVSLVTSFYKYNRSDSVSELQLCKACDFHLGNSVMHTLGGARWHLWGHLSSLRRGKELANGQWGTEACQQPHWRGSRPAGSWVVAAIDKYTQTTEILWRKRNGAATLSSGEHLDPCLDRLLFF